MDPRLVDYLASLGADPAALEGWTVSVAQRAGVDVAFVITKGPEIHIVAMAGKHTMSRRNIRQFVEPMLDHFGYVTTRVPVSETDHRLRLALGFVQQWADENYTFWALTTRPYERKQPEGIPPCLS